MLSCEQFRFLTGAAPRALGRLQQLHLADCPACALEHQKLLAFERRIEQALMKEGAPSLGQSSMKPGRLL